MRVPSSLVWTQSLARLDAARRTASEARDVASTGLRVRSAADDPAAHVAASRHQARIDEAERALRGSTHAASRLEGTDAALDRASLLLTRAKELTLSALNDSVNAGDRAATAVELREIRRGLIDAANSRVADSFIFAGFRDDSPAVDAAGTFQGTLDIPERIVAPSVTLEVGVDAQTAFGVGTTEDAFGVLDAIATALEANDTATASTAFGGLERAHDNVVRARVRVGNLLDRVDVARAATERVIFDETRARSSLIDADAFRALSDVERAELSLQTAAALAARLPLPSVAGSRG